MDAPTSRSKMDKLGKRLSTGGLASEDDRKLFSQVIDYYQALLDTITEMLVEAGLRPTSRVKTTGTLLEKLRREQGIQLTRIVDFAGARVVIDGGRADQNKRVGEILELFGHYARKPTVIDRRIQPSHGYRAVHVIVYPDGYPVEIQVRTELQDLWAQLFERFADQWGRQIRYGGPPNAPNANDPVPLKLKQDVIELLHGMSERIDLLEDQRARRANLEISLRDMHKILRDMHKIAVDYAFEHGDNPSEQLSAEAFQSYLSSRRNLIRIIGQFVPDRRRRNRIIRRHLKKDRVLADKLVAVVKMITEETGRLVNEATELGVSSEMRLRQDLEMLSQIPDRKAAR